MLRSREDRISKIHIVVQIILVLACASYGYAQEKGATLELEGRYWVPTLKADARVDGETQRGTDINLKTELGFGNKSFASGKLTWYTGPNSRLFFDATGRNFKAEKTLEDTIEFRNQTFDVGSDVSSELKFRIYRLGWIWEFIHTAEGGFKFGTLLSARAVYISLSLDGRLNDQSQNASKSYTAPLPSFGFALDLNPNKLLNFYLYSSGLPTALYGYFIEGETGIRITPVKHFGLSLGYRYEDFNAKDKGHDAQARIRFTGPFAGALLRF